MEAEMGGRHTFFLLNASLISNKECQDFCTGGGGGGYTILKEEKITCLLCPKHVQEATVCI